MTLDELIQKHQDGKLHYTNAWVDCDGFKGMYVRVSPRSIHGKIVNVIDLANIEADEPGKGTFRRLVSRLTESWPQYTIHVENALAEKFRGGLLRMGFKETNIPYCYYLPKIIQDEDS